MPRGGGGRVKPHDAEILPTRPLFALLSQVLVAFTIEFDNQFELRMSDAGDPGTRLSLVVWSNLMRFLGSDHMTVRNLATQTMTPERAVKSELGCLERWRLVVLEADSSDPTPVPTRAHGQTGRILRDGWGSGRGIRSGWIVRLTSKGRKACEIWPALFEEIERRWQTRFGDEEIGSLRHALEGIAAQLDVDLPQGLPHFSDTRDAWPARHAQANAPLPLTALLSQVLLAFAMEFDRQSRAPLALCANTLRVLGGSPIPVSEIPHLTGSSPETSGLGWQIKPYISIEPSPAAKGGKLVRLSPLGLKTQQTYRELVGDIENRWKTRFGKDVVDHLRHSLSELFVSWKGDRSLIAEGLMPPAGTVRAGAGAPALGRREIGAAAAQRARDLVAQTRMFLHDPAATLPHYPLWDMNRGFGP